MGDALKASGETSVGETYIAFGARDILRVQGLRAVRRVGPFPFSHQAVAARIAAWAARNPQTTTLRSPTGARAAVLVPLFLGADEQVRPRLSPAPLPTAHRLQPAHARPPARRPALREGPRAPHQARRDPQLPRRGGGLPRRPRRPERRLRDRRGAPRSPRVRPLSLPPCPPPAPLRRLAPASELSRPPAGCAGRSGCPRRRWRSWLSSPMPSGRSPSLSARSSGLSPRTSARPRAPSRWPPCSTVRWSGSCPLTDTPRGRFTSSGRPWASAPGACGSTRSPAASTRCSASRRTSSSRCGAQPATPAPGTVRLSAPQVQSL